MKKCNLRSVHTIILSLFVILFSACTKKPLLEDSISLADVEEMADLDESIRAVLPHIYINIADDEEVLIKDIYLNAEVYIDGNTDFQNLDKQKTRIKGRGNSTWSKPKKPYRLKLDKKSSVLGLAPAKDWILLANYNDYTLMTNAIALHIGKQLGMPFTNDIIPVDLTVNGIYRGNYNLTQQIEINENRVNIGENGVLWELDSYFDEDWKFKSIKYNLPIMLKDPDVESDDTFQVWKTEFQNFENMIASNTFPSNNYGDVFDKQQFVNFMIVNMLTGNHEIFHPKSTYIHKAVGGKYTMGPLWDFDYAFGFSEESKPKRTYFHYNDLPVILANDKRTGALFYNRLLSDPEIKSLFAKTWIDYKKNKFDYLMQFIEVYAAKVRESKKKDFVKWGVGNNNHAQNKADIKTFIRIRSVKIDEYLRKK